jgi:putative NADH-flavin reductase
MKIIVFGANGRVGQQVTTELIQRGHDVTAFIYGSHEGLSKKATYIQGDIHDAQAVKAALVDQEVVISTLGSWGTKTKDILTSAMANIIPAMHENGQKRIISLTGADANLPHERTDAFHSLMHIVFNIFARPIMHDGEEHMRLLTESKLEWTTIRSPVMSSKIGNTYSLTTKRPMPWQTIERNLVAIAMCDQVDGTKWIKQAPYIH